MSSQTGEPDPVVGYEPPENETAGRGRYDGSRPDRHRSSIAVLAMGALGVVFGDIGTSPLYAIQTVFTADHSRVHTHPVEVYGVISLVLPCMSCCARTTLPPKAAPMD